jgi:aminomethyltransferase
MPLYGHELTPIITPIEARLSFALSLDVDFIGRDALLKQKLEKPERVLVGFELVGRGVAREGYPVFHEGIEVGAVSSGMFSPTTSRYLGMAFVLRPASKIGTPVEIEIRNKMVPAKIVKRPFYTPAYRR